MQVIVFSRSRFALLASVRTLSPTNDPWSPLVSQVVDDVRCDAVEIAAFSTTAKGGLIPQARHGGKGKEALARLGSKLDGIGFEKEQIGHIHVPVVGLAELGTANGLLALVTGREEDSKRFVAGCVGLLPALRNDPRPRLRGFGWNVIFGEDLKKPACTTVSFVLEAE